MKWLVIIALLATQADAKPRAKKKKPKAAKPVPVEVTPAPAPEPPPAPEPVVVAPPAPTTTRIAVIGDAALAPTVASSLSRFERVTVGAGDPAALAAQHSLHVVVVVSSTGTAATAIAYAADGRELARAEVKGGKFVVAKKLGPEVESVLVPRIAALGPTPAPAVAAAPPSSSSSSARSVDTGIVAAAPSRARPRRDLVLAVEERPFWRRLRYNDDVDQRLRPSDLVANAVGIAAAYRPLDNFRALSLQGRGELAVGVNGSRTSDGTSYATHSSEWSLGAALDASLGPARVGIAIAYGEQRFSVDDDPAMELLPDVTYRYARGGVAFEMPLAARLSLFASGGYRQLLGTGGLADAAWFPRVSGAGIDAGAGIAIHVTPWLDVTARLDGRRYFFAMNPEPGDPWIAGGATDDYLGGAIGLAISPR